MADFTYFRNLEKVKEESDLIYQVTEGRLVFHSRTENGLPDWIFEGNFIAIQFFPRTKVLYWFSPIGPTVWKDRYESGDTVESIALRFENWLETQSRKDLICLNIKTPLK